MTARYPSSLSRSRIGAANCSLYASIQLRNTTVRPASKYDSGFSSKQLVHAKSASEVRAPAGRMPTLTRLCFHGVDNTYLRPILTGHLAWPVLDELQRPAVPSPGRRIQDKVRNLRLMPCSVKDERNFDLVLTGRSGERSGIIATRMFKGCRRHVSSLPRLGPIREVGTGVMGIGLMSELGSRWRSCGMGGFSDERDSIDWQ